MENFFREIDLYNEAWDVEHNIMCKRRFTHQELEPAIAAIREIEAAKVQTVQEIDMAMFEALKAERPSVKREEPA